MKYVLPILLMSILFISCSKEEETPENKPLYKLNDEIKAPAFDAENAFAQIEKQVSFGPRNPNSMPHQAALEYFVSEFKKYADTVALQNFLYPGYENEQLNLTNIIAKFNPKAEKRIFISAHWDCRPRGEHDKDVSKRNLPIPGANDGASGVGIILELAKILKNNPVKYGVDLILFDGEDYGKENDLNNYFLGSKYFAAVRTNYQPVFGILLDLVGDKEAIFEKEAKSLMYAPEVVNLVWKLAARINASTFSDTEGYPISDDHLPLNEAGIPTIDIIDIDLVGAASAVQRRNYWHSQKDNMDNIGKRTLQQVGDVLTNLIYGLEFN